MPIKSVKMKISKNKKICFFLMSQGSFNLKIRFLGQKVCHVARPQTHTQTHIHTYRHTRKWILRAPFQGFKIFPFNLSSRIGPILITASTFLVQNLQWITLVMYTKKTSILLFINHVSSLICHLFMFYIMHYVYIYCKSIDCTPSGKCCWNKILKLCLVNLFIFTHIRLLEKCCR